LLFQSLDDKKDCVGVYANGDLHFKEAPEDLSATWSYSSHLADMDIQYAQLYAMGKSLDDVCPPELKMRWAAINKKLYAFASSFVESKVSLKENCIYELTPERFLKEYCELKNRICEHVFQTQSKPKEYEFYRQFTQFIDSIRHRELNLDRAWLAEKLYDPQGKALWEAVGGGATNIKYNIFGSITGRLTTEKGSFPILTLSKKFREAIRPTNNWFVELDLNGAELRTAQALLSRKQVIGDFHQWSADNIFKGELTRSEAKETATQWLYNSQSKNARKYDTELSQFYNKAALLAMYWDGKKISTPFGREIDCDEYHAVSYLNQSTLIDLFHRQVLKVDSLLKDKKSFISLTVHDSVLIDLADEDKNLLPEIIKTLSDTKWGKFPASVKIGPDYGNMKKMKIKE
jgi:hypothetical protein